MPGKSESIGDLFVEIKGDVSKLKKDVTGLKNKVVKETAKIESSFSSTFKRVAKNTAAFFGIAAGAAVLSRAVSKMVSQFRAFDKEMQNVNTIIGVSADRLDVMKTAIKGLARETGTEATQLAAALYQTVSAGVDAADAMEFVGIAAKAAKAGLSTTKVAVDGLTTVTNAWHMSSQDAGKVADIMFETVKRGKTTFEELASSMSTVAGIAAASGVSFEDVSGAIASLTKQGVPTAQAVTQIRAAIISMNDVLGDGWSNAMSFAEASQAMRVAAGGSNKRLKEMVGRVEGVNAILGLTGKNAQTAADDLLAMGNAGGSMMVAFQTQTKSLDFVINRLGSTFDDVLLRVMERALPIFRGVANAMQWLADAIAPAESALERERIALIQATNEALKYQLGTKERTKAIKALKEQYPKYLSDLDTETTSNEQLAIAVKKVNDQYVLKAKQIAIEKDLASARDDVVSAASKLFDLEQDLISIYEKANGEGSALGKTTTELAKAIDENAGVLGGATGAWGSVTSAVGHAKERMDKLAETQDILTKKTQFATNALKILETQIIATDNAAGNKNGEDSGEPPAILVPIQPVIDDEKWDELFDDEQLAKLDELITPPEVPIRELAVQYKKLGEAAVSNLIGSGLTTIWQEMTRSMRKEAGVMTQIVVGMVDAILAELQRILAAKILLAATSPGGFLSFLLQHGGKVQGDQGAKHVKKMQHGGSMDVPFGFANDQYPVMVGTGERVDVTTSGRKSMQENLLTDLVGRVEALNANLMEGSGGGQQPTAVAVSVKGNLKGNDIKLSYDKTDRVQERYK